MKTKTPVWIKDKKTGKIELIPYHLMRNFRDGTRGFDLDQLCYYESEAAQFYQRHRDYFEFIEQGMGSYTVFLGGPNRLARRRRFLTWWQVVALIINAFACAGNLWNQHWLIAIIPGLCALSVAAVLTLHLRPR